MCPLCITGLFCLHRDFCHSMCATVHSISQSTHCSLAASHASYIYYLFSHLLVHLHFAILLFFPPACTRCRCAFVVSSFPIRRCHHRRVLIPASHCLRFLPFTSSLVPVPSCPSLPFLRALHICLHPLVLSLPLSFALLLLLLSFNSLPIATPPIFASLTHSFFPSVAPTYHFTLHSPIFCSFYVFTLLPHPSYFCISLLCSLPSLTSHLLFSYAASSSYLLSSLLLLSLPSPSLLHSFSSFPISYRSTLSSAFHILMLLSLFFLPLMQVSPSVLSAHQFA